MNTFVLTRQNIWAMRASAFAIVFLCLYSILNHTAAQGDGPPTKVPGVIEGLSPEEREYILSLNHPERRVFIRERLSGGSDIRDQIRSGKIINEKLTPHPRPHYKDVLGMGKIINRMRKKSK